MEKKIKTNLRMFKAEDAIWMFVAKSYHDLVDKEWDTVQIGTEGFVIVADNHTLSADWISVADDLGIDGCELVLNQDGEKYVLLYDEEKMKGTDK